MQQNRRWLNPKMFYEKYGVTLSTQAKWRMKNIIVFSKIGKFIWYDQNKIDIWLQENEITGI